jgi:cytoskeletal protein CcmA (bactofilin family)
MFGRKDVKELEVAGNISTIIGEGTVLEGTIISPGNIRIEGTVKGNITTQSRLVVSITAKVVGNILAQTADISGEINGNVDVVDLLVMKSSAVINGDVLTTKLAVESGASFNGKCTMGKEIKEIVLDIPNVKKK